MDIMKNVLEPPAPAIAAPPDMEPRVRLKPAKLAFRETLLGISVPDLLPH
jgi:hypothetical protein